MFGGPDAQLVQDALIIALLALAGGVGLTFGITRLRARKSGEEVKARSKSGLEERVEVLERIATDRSIDLADEIEALRPRKETI